jgi:hypothetical protein
MPAPPPACSLTQAAAAAFDNAALLLGVGLISGALAPAASAAAAGDIAAYDNAAGSESLRTVFGVGYVLLVGIFAVRLLTKRAKRAKSERLAGKREDGVEQLQVSAPQPQLDAAEEGRTTVWGALYGAAQAAFLFTVLLTLTTNLAGYFDAKPLPANYTARNITAAVKTAVEGLAYLLTFIFGANSLGLLALAVQLALFPDAATRPAEGVKVADRNALPKIKLTDNIYDIRRAFEEVQQQASKGSGSDSSRK